MPRPAKTHNNVISPCRLHGSHRSKLEFGVCWLLQRRADIGEIELLQAEDHLIICGPPGHPCKKKITYVADFKCRDLKTGEIFWVEAKGFPNERWPMKKALFQHYGQGRLEIYMGNWQRPTLAEIIIPICG